jgi:hypothetical protein
MSTGLFNRFDFNRDEPEGGSAPSDTLDLTSYDLVSLSISKGQQDGHWRLNATIDGYQSFSNNTKTTTYSTTDHTATSQMIFSGIIPITRPRFRAAQNKTTIEGYDYGWYLSHQPVPPAYTHITASVNPATVVTALLGGGAWETETGIEPYNIDTVTEYGTTLNSKTWDFEKSTSKWSVIEKLCDWCRYIFLVRWNTTTGAPRAYFVKETDIDTALDIPAGVTFTNPSTYIDGEISYEVKGDAKYNRVIVYGRSSTGQSLSSTLQTTDVTNGAIPVVYVESSGQFSTQTQLDTRARELLSYKASVIKIYSATLLNRMDLVPLQKVQFTGFSGIDEDWCRITDVAYTIDGPMKRVKISFMSDALYWSINQMYRESDPDLIGQIESVFDAKAAGIPSNKFGTVVSKDDPTKKATVQLDDGTTTEANYI